MRSTWAWLPVAAVTTATNARAAEDHLWAKLGANAAIANSDLQSCLKEASRVPTSSTAYTPLPIVSGGFAAGAAAGAAGYLLESLLVRYGPQGFAARSSTHHCMARRGYAWLPLSAGEKAELAQLKAPADRTAWIDRFEAGGLETRIAEAAKPLVPPLPEGSPEPLTYDGVRFDPAKLVVAKGVVPDEGTVLSGSVTVAHTALIKHAVVLRSGQFGQSVDVGATFYQVVGPAAYDREQSYWCGPFHYGSLVGAKLAISCVSQSDEGYEIWAADGGPPIAGPPGLVGGPTKDPGLDFSLAPSERDLIGPLEFKLKASWQNFYTVYVEADVSANGRKTAILRTVISYAPDGTAVLPFWTHRLVLHRLVRGGVTAEFKPDGDGKGWLDVKPAV